MLLYIIIFIVVLYYYCASKVFNLSTVCGEIFGELISRFPTAVCASHLRVAVLYNFMIVGKTVCVKGKYCLSAKKKIVLETEEVMFVRKKNV